jgi:predicted ABC-type ATPase
VPDDVVRRRFAAGLRNLFSIYMDVIDSWTIYGNADVEGPNLVASRALGASPVVADEEAWTCLKRVRA